MVQYVKPPDISHVDATLSPMSISNPAPCLMCLVKQWKMAYLLGLLYSRGRLRSSGLVASE